MNQWWVALLAVSVAACSVEHVSLEGKSCPCDGSDEYRCDGATNTCVRSSAQECEVSVEDFRWDWVTSSTIRYSWTPVGELQALVHYEIEMANSSDALGTGVGWVVGPETNPELGRAFIPRTDSGEDLVDRTLVTGLTPSTLYHARLRVTDRSGCVYRSPVTLASTVLHLPETIKLLADDGPSGRAWPSGPHYQLVDDGQDGTALEYWPRADACCSGRDGVCSPDAEVCNQNIQWSAVSVETAAISRGQFDLAILEVEVTNDTDTPSFYSRVWLRYRLPDPPDPPKSSKPYKFEPITVPSGARVVIQVPLRELLGCPEASEDATKCEGEELNLTWEMLNPEIGGGRINLPVTQVSFGGQFSRCALGESAPCTDGRILLHRAAIRY